MATNWSVYLDDMFSRMQSAGPPARLVEYDTPGVRKIHVVQVALSLARSRCRYGVPCSRLSRSYGVLVCNGIHTSSSLLHKLSVCGPRQPPFPTGLSVMTSPSQAFLAAPPPPVSSSWIRAVDKVTRTCMLRGRAAMTSTWQRAISLTGEHRRVRRAVCRLLETPCLDWAPVMGAWDLHLLSAL